MKTHSAVNRVLLALTGLVLLGAGLLVLTGGLDLYRRLDLTPPDGWPYTTPGSVLLTDAQRTRWTGEGWWWPTVIAALAVLFLLALWWLLAQLRQRRPGRLPVGTPPVAGVRLHGHALAQALAEDCARLPGVKSAGARLAGPAGNPRAHITLTLDPHTSPHAVTAALADGPLHRARRSTGRQDLTTRAVLRVASHRPHRAD
ncbi:alkaline shock response membrane anchor protein AmaP [Kitasatospora sp. NBC_01539]|uniref:alkaline shock response membrane anchor protein AmaP n=1 Tax=Kitasatospora sp. NBC_01539 TaxID=2903577 RepID=UPI003860313D